MQPAKEKLHTLYKIYEKPMYHIAYAILHHTQQTEDAVSEAFCRVIANLHKIGDPESPQTRQYMIQIIRSTAISQYRKNARESDRRSPWDDKFLQIPEDAPPCPLEQQEEQAMRQAVLAEMMEVLNETDPGRSFCCAVRKTSRSGRSPGSAASRRRRHGNALNVPEKP